MPPTSLDLYSTESTAMRDRVRSPPSPVRAPPCTCGGGRRNKQGAINEQRIVEVRLRRERGMMRESTADQVDRDRFASAGLEVLPAAPRDVIGRRALSFAVLKRRFVIAIEAPKRCRRRRSTNIRPSLIRY